MRLAEGRQLALIYGRRRIGKTYLLTHAWGDEALYFTASATSPEINRRALLVEASRWSGVELRPEDLPTWRMVFRELFELQPDEPLVIVIDEFQYLADDEDGLREVASELNAVWEGRIRRDAGLLVVLSGSAIHALSALEAGGAPLYGRLDWKCKLEPFDYWNAAEFVDWSAREKIELYGAFGGIPRYLDAVRPDESFEQNVIELLLAADGKVRLQVETAIEQEEGLRDVQMYRAVLASVGLKRRTVGDIAAALDREKDNALKRIVKRLVELSYLIEETNFDAPRNQEKRYRIADPAQRFYYGLVLPNESAIANAGPERVWSERIEPATWPTYLGFEVFEEVVRQAYLRLAADQGLPAIESWGRWQGKARDRTDIEIDIVARTLDGSVLTGAIKFTSRAADATLLTGHLDALKRLRDSGHAWAREALATDAHLFFVSAAGFKESFLEVAAGLSQPVITWDLGDIFPR